MKRIVIIGGFAATVGIFLLLSQSVDENKGVSPDNSSQMKGALTTTPSSQPQPFVFPNISQTQTAQDSKGKQVDRLTKTGDPRDSFQAFEILFNCVSLRESKRKGVEISEDELRKSCEDVTQVQILNIESYLNQAVKAGVPGALVSKVNFGPLGGDSAALETRPNDPLVVQWKTEITESLVAHARKTGELEALRTLQTIYSVDYFGQKNLELALMYDLAYLEGLKNSPNPLYRESAKRMEQVIAIQNSKKFTTEQIKKASEGAAQLRKECCVK